MRNKKIKDNEILSFINKFINYSKGSGENIDVKRIVGFHKSFLIWRHPFLELVSFDNPCHSSPQQAVRGFLAFFYNKVCFIVFQRFCQATY